ncbi:MAG: hypothetical protein SGPRY_005178 [Prymnesium sp.]
MLFTFWLEKGLLYSLQLAVKQIVCGSWLFFLFLTQTRAYHFGQALVHGRGSYVATGRGYSLEPGKFVDLYKSYAQALSASNLKLAFSELHVWLFQTEGQDTWAQWHASRLALARSSSFIQKIG